MVEEAEQPRKRDRPRDELGRPLPWDEENLLEMADFDPLTLDDCHRLGIEYFNEERFFPAHEAWENAWKRAKGTDEEELFKGLSQLGAGYVHYRRGNLHGAKTLLRRGMGRVRAYGPERRGIDIAALDAEVERHAGEVEQAQRDGRPMPELVTPKV